jgi:hypothetical protein
MPKKKMNKLVVDYALVQVCSSSNTLGAKLVVQISLGLLRFLNKLSQCFSQLELDHELNKLSAIMTKV